MMSTSIEFSALSPRQRTTLREQLLRALQNIPTDGSTSNWSDVYVPVSHLQALHPDRMVVEGMRGSGKSFWTGVLVNSELRRELGNQLLGIDLKAALASITHSHAIALDINTAASTFPSINELPQLLALPGVTPETIWSVAILRLFTVDPLLEMPQSTDAYNLWQAPITWAGKNPGRVARALDVLDQRLVSDNEIALVVFDALDRVSHDLEEVSSITAGLLRVMLNLRFARGLRLKAFIREDVLAQAGASVVDASKLLNNKVKLQWTQADLYGLAFFRIAQHSSAFRNQFEGIAKVAWRKSNAGRYECAAADEPATQKLLWRALVGDYMGKVATKGHSYPYIYNHLSDGLGRVAPRIFLTALRAAVDSASKQYAEKPYAIHHEAIKDGVREASTARVTELREEYQWIDPALQCIKDQQKTVPIDRSDLETIWLKNNASVLQTIEAMRDKALIPWRIGASNPEKIDHLRTTLEQIGIIKLRLKVRGERIELPDIYRLAYRIGRHGGISTQKKS
jgi:hypothetical protein